MGARPSRHMTALSYNVPTKENQNPPIYHRRPHQNPSTSKNTRPQHAAYPLDGDAREPRAGLLHPLQLSRREGVALQGAFRFVYIDMNIGGGWGIRVYVRCKLGFVCM